MGSGAHDAAIDVETFADAHTLSAAAHAYGTAFWASAGLSALAIIPCIILVRAERAARAAQAEPVEASPEALAEAIAA